MKTLNSFSLYKAIIKAPFVPALIWFILGLMMGFESKGRNWFWLYFFLIFFSLGLIIWLFRKSRYSIILFWLSLLGAGAFYSRFNFQLLSPNLEPYLNEKEPIRVFGKLKGFPEFFGDHSRIVLELREAFISGRWTKVKGRVRINIEQEYALGLVPGDELILMVRLRKVTNFSNPAGFDYKKYLARQGITAFGSKPSKLPMVKVCTNNNWSFFSKLQAYRAEIGKELVSGGLEGGALLSALILGDRYGISDEVENAFQDSGLLHILSISGFHLALIGSFSLGFLLLFLLLFPSLLLRFDRYRIAGALTMIPTSYYALVSGLGFPTIRSWIMVMVFLLSLVLRRERGIWNTLALACWIILLIEPSALYDLSFQLSFLAVFGITYFSPRVWRMIKRQGENALGALDRGFRVYMIFIVRKLWRYFAEIFIVGVICQFFLAPFLAQRFHQIYFFAPLHNLIIVPLVGFGILPLALSGLASLSFAPSFGSFLLYTSAKVCFIAERLIIWLSKLKGNYTFVRAPTNTELFFWMVLGFALFELLYFIRTKEFSIPFLKNFERKRNIVGCLVLMLILCSGTLIREELKYLKRVALKGELVLSVFDVGDGQSILVRLSQEKAILIDGGGFLKSDYDIGKSVVGPSLIELGIKKLDAVILTNSSPEHAKGLYYILSHFPVKEFYLTKDLAGLSKGLIEIAEDKKVRINYLDSSISPFYLGNMMVQILNPAREEEEGSNQNDRSVVILLKYHNIRILIPSDITSRVEKKLLKKYKDMLSSQILIAPHHGSKSSSSLEFVSSVSPEVVIVSAGGHSWYGTPSGEVIERYRKVGAKVFKTSEKGMIEVHTNGTGYRIILSCVYK